MRYQEFVPPPALQATVHRFWILQGRAELGRPFQRAMPDGRAELVFNLADRFESLELGAPAAQPAALLVGPTRRAIQVRPTGVVDVVGVRLRPGAIPAVLGVPARELLSFAEGLGTVARCWNGVRDHLGDRLEASDRIRVLERHLLDILARSRAPDPRLAALLDLTLRSAVAPKPDRLAAAAGLSRRQLTRLYHEGAGFGPTLLGRLVRFQRVLREIETAAHPRWTALAHRHGFYDQPHLARDFREFAGISPGRYLAAARELTRHFIDDGEGGPDG